MSQLKPWLQIVQPHEDIRKGDFDESVFAADLGEVRQGRGALDYRDPALFFKKTFFTKGIKSMIKDVLNRLHGKKGEPVIQLTTPFGGGKTHTLLSIYHIIENRKIAEKNKSIKEILNENKISSIPEARVATIVGTAIDPTQGRKTVDNCHIKTIWGELAYQLGGKELFKKVEESDKNRVPPGTDLLGKILADGKANLILLDEVLQYLLKAQAIKVGSGNLSGQTLAFFQELSVAVANSKSSQLIVTLPSSEMEHYDESGEKLYLKLKKIFGRVESIRTPVEGEEIYEIIRRRLFEEIRDQRAVENICEEYFKLYNKHSEDLPRSVRDASYKRLMIRAYPFHPEIIDIFYKKWGTIPNFQRTRGVLRLLALIVEDLCKHKNPNAIILPSDINLGNQDIRNELIKFTENRFESVIADDISGPNSKAPQIDRELGSEYLKFHVAEGLATTIFLSSFSGKGGSSGVTEAMLRLSVLNPEMTPAIIAEALNRLERKLFYLQVDKSKGTYKFTAQPNLNKILVDKEESVSRDDAIELAQQKLWDMIGEKFPKKYKHPQENRDVADIPTLSLIVLDLAKTKGKETWKKTKEFILDILNNNGSKHRTFRNVLVFLVPDEDHQEQLIRLVKRYMALQLIEKDRDLNKNLSDESREELNLKIKRTESDIPQAIASTYRHIVISGDRKDLKEFDMGQVYITNANQISNQVWNILRDQEQLLERIDPNLFISQRWSLWPEKKNLLNVKKLAEYFTQYTYLPMLASEEVIRQAIADGVARGLFAYATGREKEFDSVYYKESLPTMNILLTEDSWLLKPDYAKKFIKQPETIPEEKETYEEKKETSQEPRKIITQEGIKKLKQIKLNVEGMEWENWNDFFREVIEPLTNEGADVKISLKISAESDEGINEDTVELKIKESLQQRNLKHYFE
ncbi:MAG: ATP-binding protein [Candidatus Schekmanbacteria bacterium]|nr:MAG: ATP-binding protein [Candidatus Schekmanbacteria bacterium]